MPLAPGARRHVRVTEDVGPKRLGLVLDEAVADSRRLVFSAEVVADLVREEPRGVQLSAQRGPPGKHLRIQARSEGRHAGNRIRGDHRDEVDEVGRVSLSEPRHFGTRLELEVPRTGNQTPVLEVPSLHGGMVVQSGIPAHRNQVRRRPQRPVAKRHVQIVAQLPDADRRTSDSAPPAFRALVVEHQDVERAAVRFGRDRPRRVRRRDSTRRWRQTCPASGRSARRGQPAAPSRRPLRTAPDAAPVAGRTRLFGQGPAPVRPRMHYVLGPARLAEPAHEMAVLHGEQHALVAGARHLARPHQVAAAPVLEHGVLRLDRRTVRQRQSQEAEAEPQVVVRHLDLRRHPRRRRDDRTVRAGTHRDAVHRDRGALLPTRHLAQAP